MLGGEFMPLPGLSQSPYRTASLHSPQTAASLSSASVSTPTPREPLSYSPFYRVYVQERSRYLQSVGVNPNAVPNPLAYPSLFFYLDRPEAKEASVFSVVSFPYRNLTSRRLTKKTFPHYLFNVCQIPYQAGPYFDSFFDALDKLLRQTPRSALQNVTQEIQHLHPGFAAWLSAFNAIEISPEQNFFVSRENLSALFQQNIDSPFPYQPFYEITLDLPFPAQLMRRYLNALLAEHRRQPDFHAMPPQSPAPPESVTYCASLPGNTPSSVYSLHCRSSEAAFRILPQPMPPYGRKLIPLEQASPIPQTPQEIPPLFSGLFGSDTRLADSFARRLAAAAMPTGGMTVVYSRQNTALLQRFLELFFHTAMAKVDFVPQRKSSAVLPSLNQLVKKDTLSQLFLAQCRGAAAVMVNDILPSESSMPQIRKLLRGKKLSVSSPSCPNQHFTNCLHVFCVTDSYRNACVLQKQLKADLLDFSGAESPLKVDYPLYTKTLHWLRTAFLPHGLKLLTAPCPDSPVSQTAVFSLQEEISAFFREGCVQEEGAHCDTFALYQAFLAFLSRRCPNAAFDITKITFNKQVRQMLDSRGFKNVRYQKTRSELNGPILWRYIGLSPKPFSAAPAPAAPKADGFALYLEAINRQQPRLDLYALPAAKA